MLITTKTGWGSLKNPSSLPDLNYNKLTKVSELKDMRGVSKQAHKEEEKTITEDYKNVCEKSNMPLPGFTDYLDDESSESFAPHSDWQGPSGEAWIGK